MSFKPIETQEELNEVIGERLKRERETVEKKYADYKALQEKATKYDDLLSKDLESKVEKLENDLKAANEKLGNHDKEVADLTSRATTAEKTLLKTRIAHENGIPYELANKLSGDTEDEIKKDAESFASFVAPKTPAPPLHSSDPNGINPIVSTNAEYQGLLSGLMSK